MTAVLFDTQVALDALKASGVPEDQARTHVRVLHEALNQGVATRADIADLKYDIIQLEAKIDQVAVKLDAKIDKLDAKMIAMQWRVIATVLGSGGLLGVFLKFT